MALLIYAVIERKQNAFSHLQQNKQCHDMTIRMTFPSNIFVNILCLKICFIQETAPLACFYVHYAHFPHIFIFFHDFEKL